MHHPSKKPQPEVFAATHDRIMACVNFFAFGRMHFMHFMHKTPTCGPSQLRRLLRSAREASHRPREINPEITPIINATKTANALRRNDFRPPVALIRANVSAPSPTRETSAWNSLPKRQPPDAL
jgi:hypothetical protein